MKTLASLALGGLLVTFVPSGFADEATTSIPFSFVLGTDDCRAGLTAVGYQGGCSAAIEGTIDAACSDDGCAFNVTGTATGVRGAATVQPIGVSVASEFLTFVGEGDFPRPTLHRTCRASAAAESVACDVDAVLPGNYDFVDPDYGSCAFIGVDVSSSSFVGAENTFVPALPSHTARSASNPGDPRTPAPGWEVCLKDGALDVYDYSWYG